MSLKYPACSNVGGSYLSLSSLVLPRKPSLTSMQEQRWVASRLVSSSAGGRLSCSSRKGRCCAIWNSGGNFTPEAQFHCGVSGRSFRTIEQKLRRCVASCTLQSTTGEGQPCSSWEGSGNKPRSGSKVGLLTKRQPQFRGRSVQMGRLVEQRDVGRFICRVSEREPLGDDRRDNERLLDERNGEQGRVSFWGAMLEPISPVVPHDPHKSLINEDFAPALPDQRSFSVWDLASLWVGLVVGIPTYYMAGSLVEMGMAWWQGILTVLAGNLIVLLPMVLSGHGGTKYGIPFPVLSRAAFGIRGANVPSLLRALVGCGWFGIQTWIGGQAIFQLVNALLPTKLEATVIPWLGTSLPELSSFLLFWTLQVGIIWNGIESIREMEKYCAPILIGLSTALVGWAFLKAGGFGPMLSAPSQFIPGGAKEGQFWGAFFPALTANVGFWATLSLNIPDFTRYARSQADQLVGQAIGLPLFMVAFTFVGLAVTSATVVIFGRVISDPIEVLSLIGSLVPTLLALVGVILATLTTNIAANVVAPANALVNINPSAFSFRKAGLLTSTFSIILAPWKLIQSSQGFIYTWLIGYSALLGPVGGIIITDYFLLRHRQLDISALYSLNPDGEYWYSGGFNLRAIAALVLGVLPNIPGFLQSARFLDRVPQVFSIIYDNSWFVGFLVSSIIYWFLSSKSKRPILSLA